MNVKDLAEMIDIAFGISLSLGGILWFCLYLKLEKIYDELKETRKEKKEVKYGKWIDEEIDCGGIYGGIATQVITYCSECGEQCEYRTDFCPNCGADMRGDKETQ